MDKEKMLRICLSHGIANISRDSYRKATKIINELPRMQEILNEFENFTKFKIFLLQEMNTLDNIKLKWRNDVVEKRNKLFRFY